LARRHCRQHPFRFLAKTIQIWHRIPEAENILAGNVGPQFAQPAADHPPGDLTQGGYIKIPEINNIGPHIKLA